MPCDFSPKAYLCQLKKYFFFRAFLSKKKGTVVLEKKINKYEFALFIHMIVQKSIKYA